jgi:hypothetical protein
VLSADRFILSAVALDSDVYIPVISDSVGVIESREFARSGFINAVISEDRFIMAARTTDGNAQEGSRKFACRQSLSVRDTGMLMQAQICLLQTETDC